MVKILANGDIVSDSDPRASSSASSGTSSNVPRQGFINHDNGDIMQGQGANVSVFTSINQRLSSVGVPTWRAGPYSVDPAVSLGFLVSLIFMGFKGLLFSVILFFVAKYSKHGWNADSHGPSNNSASASGSAFHPSPSSNWHGTGNRLGQ